MTHIWKTSLVLCLILSAGFNGIAQKLKLTDVLTTLQNMEVFVENRKFKKRLVETTKAMAALNEFDAEDYIKLRDAYNKIEHQYNDIYLQRIKSDLSDYRVIKRMVTEPTIYANRYSEGYQEIMGIYKDEYMPIVRSFYADEAEADLLYLELGIELFTKLVGLIKRRRQERNENINFILATANNFLFNQLAMKKWEELRIKRPASGASSTVSIGRPPSKPLTEKPIATTVIHEPAYKPPISTKPLLGKIEGSVRFEVWDAKLGKNRPMEFSLTGRGGVESENFMQADQAIGNPRQAIQVRTGHFQTTEAFPSDTYYKLFASGSALVYAFAVNSGNTTYGFYPHQGELTDIPNEQAWDLPVEMDQKISSLPMQKGQLEIQVPDTANYIHIYDKEGAKAKDEILVVLVSRSELNMHQVMKGVESFGADVPVEQRLGKLFGDHLGDVYAFTSMEDGTVKYELDEGSFIPLVFRIARK